MTARTAATARATLAAAVMMPPATATATAVAAWPPEREAARNRRQHSDNHRDFNHSTQH